MPKPAQGAADDHGGKVVVYATLGGNVAIALIKLAAALITGSAAMLSEAVHSAVDSGNEALLLVGMARAQRPPTARYPFGFAREIYFWSFVVAVLLFGAGAGWTALEGVRALGFPETARHVVANYVVLGLSAVFEGCSLAIGLREFRTALPDGTLWQAIRRSKRPNVFIAVLEDAAALVGLALAAIGLGLAQILNAPAWDGIASLGIAAVLAAVATVLAIECRSLLIGEAAHASVEADVRRIAQSCAALDPRKPLRTMQLGPEDVLLTMGIVVAPDMSAAAAAQLCGDLEARIRAAQPAIRYIALTVAAPQAATPLPKRPVPASGRAAPR